MEQPLFCLIHYLWMNYLCVLVADDYSNNLVWVATHIMQNNVVYSAANTSPSCYHSS